MLVQSLRKGCLGIILIFHILCHHPCDSQNLVVSKSGFAGKDITTLTFGSQNEEMFPVAFADFNSDKITDIFALSRDQSTLYIFFGQENPSPLFIRVEQCRLEENWESMGFNGANIPVKIIGVVPADFNGDSILDVMITYERIRPASTSGKPPVQVVIFPGNLTQLNCNVMVEEKDVIPNLVQEPLALDINGDMIMDLFGEVLATESGNENKSVKKFWIFETTQGTETPIRPQKAQDFVVVGRSPEEKDNPLMNPHANSYADVDGDLVPELILLTEVKTQNSTKYFEREIYKIEVNNDSIRFHQVRKPSKIIIQAPEAENFQRIGQSVFMDLNQDATLLHILPFCSSGTCKTSNGILVVAQNGTVVKLPVQFADDTGTWTYFFYDPDREIPSTNIYSNYTSTINLRQADFNLDGFPDLIGILRPPGSGEMNGRAVLFENIPCEEVVCPYPRTFRINFKALSRYQNVTLATFFDLHEDGLVDIILMQRTNPTISSPYSDTYSMVAFQNSPDYDAMFMKVMVLSGLTCQLCPQNNVPYGNLISGPVIKYMTTTQVGVHQTAAASQLYRSSHMPMDLPYTIFGIGSSPNFIETLQISVWSADPQTQQWTQLIPNSHIIVIPPPLGWTAKLFLTPSRAVLNTALVLIGFCTVVAFIIGGLEYKERRDDMKEKLQEAHRFHMM